MRGPGHAEPQATGATRREFLSRASGTVVGGLLTGVAIRPDAAAATFQQAPAGGAARRVIIDTDPGVDDALAIFLALRSPELKVEALTPVAGNVPLELTLPNALRLVEIAGRTDIPVAIGASKPLTRKLITAAYAHGENGLGGVQFPEPKTKPVSETASQLIRRIVRAHPGEVSILALGPLTNLAIAFREDLGLAKMVRSIVLMGGSLSRGNVTPSAEFNIYVDPEAAQEVFHAGVPTTMVGLDVTRKAMLRDEHIKRLEAANHAISQAAGKITRSIADRMRRANFNGGPTMHDSVAVAVFLDPNIAKLQDYYIDVETAGEFTAGETVGYTRAPIRRSAPPAEGAAKPELTTFQPNAKVAIDLDTEKFFELLIGRISGDHPAAV
jgi:inosine-uridine nucleoside N-ribohydrolase